MVGLLGIAAALQQEQQPSSQVASPRARHVSMRGPMRPISRPHLSGGVAEGPRMLRAQHRG